MKSYRYRDNFRDKKYCRIDVKESDIYNAIFYNALNKKEFYTKCLIFWAQDQYAAKNAAILGFSLQSEEGAINTMYTKGANINCAIFGYGLAGNVSEIKNLLDREENNNYLNKFAAANACYLTSQNTIADQLLIQGQYEKQKTISKIDKILNNIGDVVFRLLSYFSIKPSWNWIKPLEEDLVCKLKTSKEELKKVKDRRTAFNDGKTKENDNKKPKKLLLSNKENEVVYLCDKQQYLRFNLFSQNSLDSLRHNEEGVKTQIKESKNESKEYMSKIKKNAMDEIGTDEILKLTKIRDRNFLERIIKDKSLANTTTRAWADFNIDQKNAINNYKRLINLHMNTINEENELIKEFNETKDKDKKTEKQLKKLEKNCQEIDTFRKKHSLDRMANSLDTTPTLLYRGNKILLPIEPLPQTTKKFK